MKESEEEDLIHKDCPEQSFDPEISDLGNLINRNKIIDLNLNSSTKIGYIL